MQMLKINFLLLLLLSTLSATYIKPTYSLEQSGSKHSLRVGETFTLSLILRSKALEDAEIPEVVFENFRIKNVQENSYKDTDNNWVESLNYILQAKKVGKFTLKAQEAKIEYLDSGYKGFNDRYKYLHKQTLKSNTIDINVFPLPKNIEVIGLYELGASVDKNETDKFHPIVYTITLKGDGNLETLDKLQLQITNAKVYAKKSIKHDNVIIKRFDILCDESIVIPALSLQYFNQVFSEVRTLRTDSFSIKVFSSMASPSQIKGFSFHFVYLLALVVVFLLLLLKFSNIFTPNQNMKKYKALKKSKTKEELLKKVAIYLGKYQKLDTLIYELEKISEKEFAIIKKRILHTIYTFILK